MQLNDILVASSSGLKTKYVLETTIVKMYFCFYFTNFCQFTDVFY